MKNLLTITRNSNILYVTRNKKGVRTIAEKSRADYMKARRETQKTFSVAVDKKKMLKFEQKLSEQQKTKSEWLNEKIDEELKK